LAAVCSYSFILILICWVFCRVMRGLVGHESGQQRRQRSLNALEAVAVERNASLSCFRVKLIPLLQK